MKPRFITAAAILAVAIVMLIFSDTLFLPLLMGACALCAVFELLRCVGTVKHLVLSIPACVISFSLPIGAFFVEDMYFYFLLSSIVCFVFMIYMFFLAVFHKGVIRVQDIALAYIFVSYVSISLSNVVLVRHVEESGLYFFILIFVIAWITDVFAYIVGSLFGKHKLIPSVSPKKSVEGAIGGVVGAMLGCAVVAFIMQMISDLEPNYLMFLLVGFVGAVISQLGDLVASLVKREYGIKDYSNLLPGHGGIMDRFDSIIPVATVVLLFAMLQGPFALIALPV